MTKLKPCPFCGGTDIREIKSIRVAYSICNRCKAEGPFNIIESMSLYGWNTRAAPKVKTLVWEGPTRATNGTWVAKTIIGNYCVGNDDGWHATLYDGIDKWEWEPEEHPKSYKGPHAAKAAAQADYERRILAAIEGGLE